MSNPADTLLGFGKYASKTIGEVYDEDASYARYIFKNMDERTDPAIREFLSERFDVGDDSYILRWGKFRGQSLNQVHAHAPAYIKWLKSSAFVNDKCPRLRSDLEAFD